MKISPVNMEKRVKLAIRAGDTVDVVQKIKEGAKFRLQSFEGLVLAHKHGNEAGATFTVRRVASGVGVEKVFPLYSPMIEDIKILKRAKVRRAKLYHIRTKATKEVSRQLRNVRMAKEEPTSAVAEVPKEEKKEAAK